ncbi:hypothetical protein Tco_0941904 [Tanacetum coccineum]|uniref:Uncharacterized protein n=1 Tax=Tanacetum coccineum TaxID=301880 RepID=A0ABQ5DYW5_9ASTR
MFISLVEAAIHFDTWDAVFTVTCCGLNALTSDWYLREAGKAISCELNQLSQCFVRSFLFPCLPESRWLTAMYMYGASVWRASPGSLKQRANASYSSKPESEGGPIMLIASPAFDCPSKGRSRCHIPTAAETRDATENELS